MLKKLLMVAWFGNTPEWYSKFEANIKTWEKYGFDLLPICSDYETYKAYAKRNLNVEIDIRPGSWDIRKTSDFGPTFGVMFQEHLKGYDFWGHINLDVIYGRPDHFIPDEFLDQCDIYSDEPKGINGVFTLYRNIEKINTLFMRYPQWKEILESHVITLQDAFDEVQFSQTVMDLAPKENIRLVNRVFQNHDSQPTQYYSAPSDIILKEDGTLWNVKKNKELLFFHFNTSKKWIW